MDARVLEQIMPNVRIIARQLSKGKAHLGVEYDDLVQVGLLGAWQAMGRYDGSVKLETFCEPRIRGAMIDEMRRGPVMNRRTLNMQRRGQRVPALRQLQPRHNRHRSQWATPQPAEIVSDGQQVVSLVRSLGVEMTRQDRVGLEARYNGSTLVEIGAIMGVGETRISLMLLALHGRIRAALVAQGRDWRTAFA